MDDRPLQAHSFIVKVWSKRVDDASQDATWRGSVTHVESGERLYLKRLVQIPGFIAPFVSEVGGTIDAET